MLGGGKSVNPENFEGRIEELFDSVARGVRGTQYELVVSVQLKPEVETRRPAGVSAGRPPRLAAAAAAAGPAAATVTSPESDAMTVLRVTDSVTSPSPARDRVRAGTPGPVIRPLYSRRCWGGKSVNPESLRELSDSVARSVGGTQYERVMSVQLEPESSPGRGRGGVRRPLP